MLLLPTEFIAFSERMPIIDVRTPAEYEQGHIPEAYNIPLFSNEERAEVGTIYKQKGKEAAVERGLDFVGSKLHYFVEETKKIASNKEILVHCWRGGMRSQSMVWLLKTAGFDAHSLLGGYKAYRKLNRELLSRKTNILVVGGYTGSGKTHILKAMALQGEQVIDLESLAHHKGSVFGHIGEQPQPTTEQFENDLAKVWRKLDFNRPVWIEDESKAIGNVMLPEATYHHIRNNMLWFIDVPIELRIKHLVKDYEEINLDDLTLALTKIIKRLGGNNYKLAMEAFNNKNLSEVARILLNYYDKAYTYGMSLRNPEKTTRIEITETNFDIIAQNIIQKKQDEYRIETNL